MVFNSDIHGSKSQHREIVALLGVAYELVDGVGHRFNQLLWRSTLIGSDDIRDALPAEKLAFAILGFCQTVGIKE